MSIPKHNPKYFNSASAPLDVFNIELKFNINIQKKGDLQDVSFIACEVFSSPRGTA